MEDRRFDRLALLLGTAPTRRTVLRLLAAGVASALLARSPRPVAAALCPERVPKPGFTPTANGCGPDGYDYVVPDTWKKANFTAACSRHDVCYGTCNSSRLTCDFLFRRHLRQACERAYKDREDRPLLRRCYQRTNLYFDAVQNHGQDAYDDAQAEACDCCESGTKCGDRCCETGSGCCGGHCCANGSCCGGQCCEAGGTCCNPQSGLCCSSGQECCNSICYNAAKGPHTPCGTGCCQRGHVCCPGDNGLSCRAEC